jgi:hypothetical protein
MTLAEMALYKQQISAANTRYKPTLQQAIFIQSAISKQEHSANQE